MKATNVREVPPCERLVRIGFVALIWIMAAMLAGAAIRSTPYVCDSPACWTVER